MTLISLIRRKLFQSTPEPKILFLHGFTRSGAAFEAQTQPLQTALKTSLDSETRFHFPNGTIRVNPLAENEDASYAWWRKDDETDRYVGLEETMRFLGNYLDFHGPFDGVIGFSQGACLAAMLASALENDRNEALKAMMVTDHPPLKFCVSIGGFKPVSGLYAGFYTPMISTPVLNVLGKKDDIVTPDRSTALANRCQKCEVVWHDGGHRVPKDQESLQTIMEFVRQHVPRSDDGTANEIGTEGAGQIGKPKL